MTFPRARAALLTLVLVLTGCSSTPTGAQAAAPDPIAGMTLAQEVGTLFVVGARAGGSSAPARRLVAHRSVRGVFLSGRSSAGVTATAAEVKHLRRAGGGAGLLIATDQEGGKVQVLSGAGFDRIPSALQQGSMAPSRLRAAAARWGAQLHAAGITVDLGPVADVVTSTDADNPPIADLDREYGTTATAVGAHAGAFASGLRDAGVVPTFKHFPGLGYVDANTDTSTGVTDRVTVTGGPTAASFATLAATSPSLVMVSSAVYARIDRSAPAVFSPTVVTGLLRDRLGYGGLVITDDLSAAKQVSSWTPGQRATLALAAGCDLILVSTKPAVADAMIDAVIAKAQSDPAFRATVDAAARRVLSEGVTVGIIR